MTNNRNICIYTTEVVLTVPICCFIFQANYLYIFQLFILFLTIKQYNFFLNLDKNVKKLKVIFIFM